MNLKPYIARGFPGKWDKLMENTPVKGIDRQQVWQMVRLCPETEGTLYGSEFSPRAISYKKGSRPVLESIAAGFKGRSAEQKAVAAMKWVSGTIRHPHHAGFVRGDRGLSEEALVKSGRGWCNEQSRVFVALCEVMGIPARMCFLFHKNKVCGHTTTELFINRRWAFFDVTFGVTVRRPDGKLAEARELSGKLRPRAHKAYRAPLKEYFSHVLPFTNDAPGWNPRERPAVERGGDLLHTIGICNYLIKGATAKPA